MTQAGPTAAMLLAIVCPAYPDWSTAASVVSLWACSCRTPHLTPAVADAGGSLLAVLHSGAAACGRSGGSGKAAAAQHQCSTAGRQRGAGAEAAARVQQQPCTRASCGGGQPAGVGWGLWLWPASCPAGSRQAPTGGLHMHTASQHTQLGATIAPLGQGMLCGELAAPAPWGKCASDCLSWAAGGLNGPALLPLASGSSQAPALHLEGRRQEAGRHLLALGLTRY